MQNKPFFANLKKVKGVITPEGQALTLKLRKFPGKSDNFGALKLDASDE